GVINLIAKRGTYPGFGSVLALVGGNGGFNHQLNLEYGFAGANGRISNYFSYDGQRESVAGYGYNANPVEIGQFGGRTTNNEDDLVDNFVYKFGRDLNQSVQLFGEFSQFNVAFGYGLNGNYSALNYKSNDPYWLANASFFSGLSAGTIQSLLPLYPYQPSVTSALTQNPEAVVEPNNTLKIQYNNNLDPSTFLAFKLYRTDAVVNFNIPINGAFIEPSAFLQQGGQRSGGALDIVRQLGSKNLLKIGTEYDWLHPVFDFFDPQDGFTIATLDYGSEYDFLPASNPDCLALQAASATPTNPSGTNPCGYLNSQGIANPGSFPGITEITTTNAQQFAAYVTDEFTPTSRTHIDAGIRFDGQNTRYATTDSAFYAAAKVNAAGFPLNAAGQPVTSDTEPYLTNVPSGAVQALVPQPRLAIAQQLGPNDSIRASFARTVEFPSLGTVDNSGSPGNYTKFANVPANLSVCGVTGNLTCRNYGDQLFWEAQDGLLGVPYQPVLPETFTNYDFSYSHQFSGNVGIKITPFYRRGYNETALVANPRLGPNGQPLLAPGGTVIFGPSLATNDGVERTTGVEFLLTKESPYGLSGQVSATYINEVSNVIPLTPNEDFFPSIPTQSLALGNLYRVGFLSPFQATLAMQYKFKSGLRINPQIYYIRGYPISPGTITAAYVNGIPVNVPNTNVTNPNGATSSFSYVDPQNPGSQLDPNIAATRGTADAASAGGVIGNAGVYANLSIDYSPPGSRSTIGVQIFNLFSNVYCGFGEGNCIGTNPYYQPVASGISGPLSGYTGIPSEFLPSLGLPAYYGAAVNGQQPYGVNTLLRPTTYQVYYQYKF
ncbi:MAG: TonB-dependent receptor domain-containing protein, partial [Vulcanimicrobiaceae bacterium]